MFPKGKACGKHLVIGPEREIYSNVSRKIMQPLFCHIGYITVYIRIILPDAETRRLIQVIGCYNLRVSLEDIRSKCHYSSKNNVKIYLKILFFCNYKPYFQKSMKLNQHLPRLQLDSIFFL